jgi:hypothetical protein
MLTGNCALDENNEPADQKSELKMSEITPIGLRAPVPIYAHD